MKKVYLFLVLFAGIFSSCSPKTEGLQLHFDENGEFKILQLTDLHYDIRIPEVTLCSSEWKSCWISKNLIW